MTRKMTTRSALAFLAGLALSVNAQAAEPPKMPYVFEKFCYPCHMEGVQTGPVGILDMRTKAGNPLNPEFIRSNARFGYNAMPAFRPSEVSDKALDDIVSYLKALAAYRKTHPGYPRTGEKRGNK